MQILLSCAKTMSSEGSFAAPRTTAPRFLREAEELVARMAALTTDELARLLRVNAPWRPRTGSATSASTTPTARP